MDKKIFIENGNWYKGNLHCHSTISDGHLTVEQLKQAYREKGYSFLACSDHNEYIVHKAADDPDFITLPSVEVSIPTPENDFREFHFNIFLGTEGQIKKAEKAALQNYEKFVFDGWKGEQSIQDFIDDMTARGNMVMLNHPYWSTIEYDDILKFNNIFGMEIYNYCSEILENMGDSVVLWDSLLRRNYRVWGTATDDNHNRFGLSSQYCDSFGGFVVVKAEKLSRNEIMKSLLTGSFYSSTGPEIYDYRIQNNKVIFKCSPVNRIYMNTESRKVAVLLDKKGINSLTEFNTELSGEEKYVRIECIDTYGRSAYTNPIFLISI